MFENIVNSIALSYYLAALDAFKRAEQKTLKDCDEFSSF